MSVAGSAIGAGIAAILGVTILRQEGVAVPGAQYPSTAEYAIPSISLVSPQLVPAANDGAEASTTNQIAGIQGGITIATVPLAAVPPPLNEPRDPQSSAGPRLDNSLDVPTPSLPVATPEHSADFVPSAVLSADLSQPKLDALSLRPALATTGPYVEVRSALTLPRAEAGSDQDAILAALQKYSRAWSDKDIADILALRPHLGRRTVKQELADVRSIAMRIRPIGPPKIEGDQAAVDCIHEVSETFGDGIARQKPGTRMTYFLARGSAGSWQISDSR